MHLWGACGAPCQFHPRILGSLSGNVCSRERERVKLHYVHSASLAYEDGSVFMSGPFADKEGLAVLTGAGDGGHMLA